MHLSRTYIFSFSDKWLKVVYVSVNEVDGHPHIIVDIDRLLLIDLNRAKLIFSSLFVVDLVSEQLRLDRDLRQGAVELVVRQEFIVLHVLEKLNSKEILV